MYASFNHFEIEMTKKQALSASHPGLCDLDVKALLRIPAIKRQLAKISDSDLTAELSEYGAWDETELSNRAENEERIIWIAAGNIAENEYEKAKSMGLASILQL
jgi:hypothetical protein